jgi:hypothetical protein
VRIALFHAYFLCAQQIATVHVISGELGLHMTASHKTAWLYLINDGYRSGEYEVSNHVKVNLCNRASFSSLCSLFKIFIVACSGEDITEKPSNQNGPKMKKTAHESDFVFDPTLPRLHCFKSVFNARPVQ